MNIKNLFSTVSLICLSFGVTLAFFPDYIGNQYLTDPSWINPGAKLVAQGYGTLLIAFAVACWYGRGAEPSLGRRAMIVLILLSDLALVIVHSLAIINKVETPIAWVTVFISVVLTVWSGMLLRQGTDVAA
ncbi:hypothetical protein IC229_13960 [Spirosoma sp. BT702]|uniref:DUF4345 domain-containing protein n=1 Tax=Spirosoma profusum TaxID=2771354 RepID=A0A926Y3F4_9BACT|nr:hypothetical protein [Spirosoma profusum]MBD2701751.1 hypothetical protein [Spirosoma profusum]